MYELVQVGEDSFYMDCPTKVGFYRVAADEVVLIDSGSDKDAAKKVKKILDAQGWKVRCIFNTHSHADHIGGNQYLQKQYGCRIYAPGMDAAFTEFPILEPTFLYGGYAMKELHNKFLMAKESEVEKLTDQVLPEGMEILNLPGHSYDMVGFRTKDDVVYLADCLSSAETLEKYQLGFLYDVKSYLETLEMIKGLQAKCFVPAHVPQCENIVELAQINIDKTNQIVESIFEILENPMCFDDLLAAIFEHFGLTMTLQQRMLIGSATKGYLTYLKEMGRIGFEFVNNKMIWKQL